MANVTREQQELTNLRADELSYASQLSAIENRILEQLNRKKILAMEEHNILRKTQDIRERESELISDLKSDARALAQDMAEYVGASRKNLPYQEKLVSMQVELEHLESLGVTHLDNMQSARRKDLIGGINMTKQLQEQRIQFEKTKEVTGGIEKALGIQEGAVASIGGKLKNLILNPWTAIVGLLALAIIKFKDIQGSAEDFRKNTGLTTSQTEQLDKSVKSVYTTLKPLGVGFEDVYKSAQALYETMGNMSLVTKDNTKFVAEMAANMGVAETTSAEFVKSMGLVGADVEGMSEQLMNMAIESGVSVSQIMSDIAESSADAYGSMSKNPEAFLRTAVQARKIGLSMKQISDMAEGLLDIESSLGAEMEAQILSGRAINLDAARYFALQGDIEGVMNEVTKQFTTIDDFNSMGVLAQRAYAKALGVSVDELAKTIKLKEDDRNLSQEERDAAKKRIENEKTIQGDLTKISNSWKTIVSDVSSIFLPAIEALVPAFKWIAEKVASIHKWINSLPDGLSKTVQGAAALGLVLGGVMGAKGIGKMMGGIGGMFGKLGGGIGKGISGMTSGILSPIKDFINTVKPTQVLAASAALIMISGAFWIAADALQKMAGVSWETLGQAGLVLLGLVGALAAIGALMMSGVGAVAILAGAAALLVIGGSLWIVADAMEKMANSSTGLDTLFKSLAMINPAQLMGVGAGLYAVSAGLGAMAVGAAAMGIVGAIFGGGATTPPSTKDKTDIVIEKLETLIEILDKKVFELNMDGAKVSKQLAKANSYGI